MGSINALANLFREYQIYPNSKYTSGTPLKEFQRSFPMNYYTKEIDLLLKKQDYPALRRGADLPWWSENFFSNITKPKIMLIAQDSNALDAGSVVMYSHLYNEIPNTSERAYQDFINTLSTRDLFKYSSWKRAFNQLKEWQINFENIYFTDAKKVYKHRIDGQKDSFDNAKSATLLQKEIEIAKPDYIITLGSQAFNLLSKTTLIKEKRNYAHAVEFGEIIKLSQGKLIVSPFITGQCHTSPNFRDRLKIATELIHREISDKY